MDKDTFKDDGIGEVSYYHDINISNLHICARFIFLWVIWTGPRSRRSGSIWPSTLSCPAQARSKVQRNRSRVGQDLLLMKGRRQSLHQEPNLSTTKFPTTRILWLLPSLTARFESCSVICTIMQTNIIYRIWKRMMSWGLLMLMLRSPWYHGLPSQKKLKPRKKSKIQHSIRPSDFRYICRNFEVYGKYLSQHSRYLHQKSQSRHSTCKYLIGIDFPKMMVFPRTVFRSAIEP